MARKHARQIWQALWKRSSTGAIPVWRWLVPVALSAIVGVFAFAGPGIAPAGAEKRLIRIQQEVPSPPPGSGAEKPESPPLSYEEQALRRIEASRAAFARLAAIILALDPKAQRVNNSFAFTIDGIPLNVVTDPEADRMRIFTMVTPEAAIGPDLLTRLLQANFDTALDARYALAQGFLWSVYIHPLSPLTEDQIVSGISQTVTLVKTFGSTFTSGVFSFGGGDSVGILEDELRKRLEKNPPVIPDDDSI